MTKATEYMTALNTANINGIAQTPFNPERNMPGCMMPDGGDCCEGYQALLADWRRLRVSNDQRGCDLVTVIAQRDAAETALQKAIKGK